MLIPATTNTPIQSTCQYPGCRRKDYTASMGCRCTKLFCEVHKVHHDCGFDHSKITLGPVKKKRGTWSRTSTPPEMGTSH